MPNSETTISPCRAAFEDWAQRHGFSLARWQDGGYMTDLTANLWSAWKAGRVWADAARELTDG